MIGLFARRTLNYSNSIFRQGLINNTKNISSIGIGQNQNTFVRDLVAKMTWGRY